MSYQALYRKYRPSSFDAVIGQPHIVKTLKNQIENGRVSHAYLFCGTRGTGKTSTAKIFAKAINCEHPVDGAPCGVCRPCTVISEGRSVNVIEIDAASNNGVDNIREIREEVKYPPTEGRFKVYIIDEVHMLSTGAFNALLKTLEEPPAHVVFILATTDPQKVPPTILSRCQRYDFRRISSLEIAAALKAYLEQEEIAAEDAALSYIARLADGAMRDALSILDQCIAFYFGEAVTLERVLAVVGSPDEEAYFQMADAVLKKDAGQAMALLDRLMMEGRECGQFVSQFISHLRNLLFVLTMDGADALLDISKETADALSRQAKEASAAEALHLITVFSSLESSLRYTRNSRILLEVCLLKLCSPVQEDSVEGVAARLAALERQVKKGVAFPPEQVQSTMPKEMEAAKTKKAFPPAQSEDQAAAVTLWPEVAAGFSGATHGLLKQVSLAPMGDGQLYLICPHESAGELLKKKLPEIAEALSRQAGKEFPLAVVTRQVYDAWRRDAFLEEEQTSDDLEFDNLMKSYLPDAEFEE